MSWRNINDSVNRYFNLLNLILDEYKIDKFLDDINDTFGFDL